MVASNGGIPSTKYNPQITLTNMLQVLFIGLKLTEQIDWSWFLVLLPVIIEVGLIVLSFVLIGIAKHIEKKQRQAEREEVWKKLQGENK